MSLKCWSGYLWCVSSSVIAETSLWILWLFECIANGKHILTMNLQCVSLILYTLLWTAETCHLNMLFHDLFSSSYSDVLGKPPILLLLWSDCSSSHLCDDPSSPIKTCTKWTSLNIKQLPFPPVITDTSQMEQLVALRKRRKWNVLQRMYPQN